MSNGTQLNSGTGGDLIYDVDGGDGKKYPVSALMTIVNGSPGVLVAPANPMPVRYCDGAGFVTPVVGGQLPTSLGQATMAASLSVTIASNQSSVPVTAVQGTAAALSGFWPVKVTDGTNAMPTGDAIGRAIFHKLTDGTNAAAVKAASTAAVAADPALVVALSPNAPPVAAVTRLYQAFTPGTPQQLSQNVGGLLRVSPMHEIDAGSSLGALWALAPEISEDFRTRVEHDNFQDAETFCYSAQNTAKHTVDTTTQTVVYSATGVTLNGGAITTLNTGSALSTRRSFAVQSSASLQAYIKAVFTGTWKATNTTIDFGFFQRPTATPYAPTDGAFFRADSTGLYGCTIANGTLQTTPVFKAAFGGADFAPTSATEYDFIISTQPSITVFWVDQRDGNGYTRMGALSNASTTGGRPMQAGSVPFSIRHAIGGSAASAALTFKLIEYGINLGGQAMNMPWFEAQSAAGHSGAQGLSGQTQGSTASYANSTAPTAAVMTNTTAALGTGLGGQFACTPTLALNTDGIVCSFQNPAGSATVSGRTLVIDSIKIDAIVVGALSASPPVYVYSAAWGHTAVSLATAEATNAKAPRRKTLGAHAISAVAVGSSGAPIGQIATTDVAVQPGEFFAVTAKNVASALPASGTILFLVTVCSHWN